MCPSLALGEYSKMVFFLPYSQHTAELGHQTVSPLRCPWSHSIRPGPVSRVPGWDLPASPEWSGKIPSPFFDRPLEMGLQEHPQALEVALGRTIVPPEECRLFWLCGCTYFSVLKVYKTKSWIVDICVKPVFWVDSSLCFRLARASSKHKLSSSVRSSPVDVFVRAPPSVWSCTVDC